MVHQRGEDHRVRGGICAEHTAPDFSLNLYIFRGWIYYLFLQNKTRIVDLHWKGLSKLILSIRQLKFYRNSGDSISTFQ